jgi:hypothetical protein
MRRTARAVGRAKPLADDTLAAELASFAINDHAVLIEMLIEDDAQI